MAEQRSQHKQRGNPAAMLAPTHLCMLCWWCALGSSLLAAALLHTRRRCSVLTCLLQPPGPSSLSIGRQACNFSVRCAWQAQQASQGVQCLLCCADIQVFYLTPPPRPSLIPGTMISGKMVLLQCLWCFVLLTAAGKHVCCLALLV
jgi:hypothetical protein